MVSRWYGGGVHHNQDASMKNKIDYIPTAHDVKRGRERAGLSVLQASQLTHRSVRAWQHYESGTRVMDSAVWELFLLKTKQVKL